MCTNRVWHHNMQYQIYGMLSTNPKNKIQATLHISTTTVPIFTYLSETGLNSKEQFYYSSALTLYDHGHDSNAHDFQTQNEF